MFGNGCNGQMGCGYRAKVRSPLNISFFNNIIVTQISLGAFHSLALDDTGNVYSWGQGKEGCLGHGNTLDCFLPNKIINLSEQIKQVNKSL